MKLKAKFLLPALILIIAGMSITTWVTYLRSTDSLSAVAVEKAKTNLTSLLSLVEVWVDGAQNEIITLSKTELIRKTFAQGSEDPKTMDHALALLHDTVSRHPNFDSVLIINAQGIAIGSTNPALQGANLANREYFQKAIAGQEFLSNPLFSQDKGEAVFVIATPVKIDGKIVGVLSSGVKIGQFSNQFVKPLDTPAGFAFILAPDGLALAHPDSKLVGKFNVFKETDYGPKIAGQTSGSLDTVSLGVEKLIIFEKSKRTGWVVGMAVNKAVAFADARSLGLLILAMSAGQAVILAGGILIILSINVLRPVDSLVGAATRIADGDLDTVLDANRRDEIGSLQKAMAKMVANLKAKIGEAEDKGKLAAEETEKARAAMSEAEEARHQAELAKQEGMLLAAKRLEDIVAAVTEASEAIAGQIAQSSQGSQEQSHRVGETATAMEEMNATVLEVAQNAAQAAQTADEARNKAGDGSSIVSRVIASIGEVQTKALELKDDMMRLGQQAEGIGQIMNVISDIADQTNLLALNAAIEAARAGDAGRGFAVVADEVRKLAEKTMTATKEVGESIQGIQQGTRKNITNVDQAATRINDATTLAGQSGEALTAIVSLVDKTTDQVRSIATASEQQSATTEEINRSIMDISRISSETAEALRQSSDALAGLTDQTQVLRGLIDEMQAGEAGHETPRVTAARKRPALPGRSKA
ncbi:MAG: methyl-accepting chemotaxis protein [Solidesulfovibrio sp.]